MDNETELAALWHEIASISPEKVLPRVKIDNISEDAGGAQPGYVGSSFETGRLLFVGMYPGGETRGSDNDAVFEAIGKVQIDDNLDSFWFLNNVLRNEISSESNSWSVWKYIKHILMGAGYGADEFALINLCPWRCSSSKGAAEMYEECWEEFTKRQIEMLRPRVVVALGTPISKGGTGFFLYEKKTKKEFNGRLLSIRRAPNDRNYSEHEAPYVDCEAVVGAIQRRPEQRKPLRPAFDPVI